MESYRCAPDTGASGAGRQRPPRPPKVDAGRWVWRGRRRGIRSSC